MTAAVSGFAGFRPAALAFLSELQDNNDPVWFKPRKALYEAEVLAPFRELIAVVSEALGRAGLPLIGDPRRGIFRIYRDVRFSPDKRLYKTHAGAVLTRSGGRRDPGVLYIHVAPGESMVAAGFWHPEPALLGRLRRAVLGDPDSFLAIAGRLTAAGCPLSSDERLSRPPRGFEAAKGTAVEEYVGWKSFTARRVLEDAEMQSPMLVDRIVDFTHTVLPLLEWGWAAADDEVPPPPPADPQTRAPAAKTRFLSAPIGALISQLDLAVARKVGEEHDPRLVGNHQFGTRLECDRLRRHPASQWLPGCRCEAERRGRAGSVRTPHRPAGTAPQESVA